MNRKLTLIIAVTVAIVLFVASIPAFFKIMPWEPTPLWNEVGLSNTQASLTSPIFYNETPPRLPPTFSDQADVNGALASLRPQPIETIRGGCACSPTAMNLNTL